MLCIKKKIFNDFLLFVMHQILIKWNKRGGSYLMVVHFFCTSFKCISKIEFLNKAAKHFLGEFLILFLMLFFLNQTERESGQKMISYLLFERNLA